MSETKLRIRIGNQSITADANGESPSPPEATPWIRLSDFDNRGAFWQRVKQEFMLIAGDLPAGATYDWQRLRGQLLTGEIARAAGFSITNNVLSFNPANAQIDKFTYWMAFRLPFEAIKVTVNKVTKAQSHPDSFTDWWKACNRIRVKYWQDNVNNSNITIYKRLHANGEEEIRDRAALPVNETTPDIEPHAYNTQSKYDLFVGTLHKRLRQSFFGTGVTTQIPVPYYLQASIEAPLIGDGWLDAGKSVPYNVSGGIPFPASNFKKAVAKNISQLNASNQLVPIPVTAFFYPTSRGQKKNYRQFPVFGTVISNNANPALNGKIQISAFLFTNQTVVITPLKPGSKKSNYDNKPYSIRQSGDIYVFQEKDPPIFKDQGGVNNYDPDIYNAVNFNSKLVFYDAARDVNYVQELQTTPVTLYADLELPAGLQASQLAGHRLYGIGQTGALEFSALIPDSNAVSNQTNDTIEGNSGITLAIGVDLGAFDSATDKFAKQFEDEILSPNYPDWATMPETQKAILRGAYHKHQKEAADYWVQHVDFFSKLDLQRNSNSYRNVLISSLNYIKTKYLRPALEKRLGTALKAALNFTEEFVLVSLAYNSDAIIINNRTALIEAINTHNYQKLLNIVIKAKASTYTAEHIEKIISKTAFKDYYRTVHFNNL